MTSMALGEGEGRAVLAAVLFGWVSSGKSAVWHGDETQGESVRCMHACVRARVVHTIPWCKQTARGD
jgi:hypothetical protein